MNKALNKEMNDELHMESNRKKNVERIDFENMRLEIDKTCVGLDRIYNTLSAARAMVFLAAIVCLAIGLKDGVLPATILGIVLVVAFIVLVSVHSRVAQKKDFIEHKKNVVSRYISRYDESWRGISDDGSQYILEGDTVSVDIDLLGPSSLYQLINVAHTEAGRKRLAEELRNVPEYSKDELDERRAAVADLSNRIDFAVEFEALGEKLEKASKKSNIASFVEACEEGVNEGLPVWAQLCRILLPVAELTFILLFVFGLTGYGYALVGFMVLLAFSWLTKPVTDRQTVPFVTAGYMIEGYRDMMELVAGQQFDSGKLNTLRQSMDGEHGALNAFRGLSRLSQAYSIVFNPLIHQVLCGVLLWDYQLAAIMCRWKRRYGEGIAQAVDAISEIEFLSSLAVLKRVRHTGTAEVYSTEASALCVAAKNLRHPLIDESRVVGNDADMAEGIIIITGSNMSGKTTFLRTLAMNLVLAYIGAPVCADSLKAPYMKLFTSMRITDDVAHGISTFYAEILRIKAMAEYREKYPDRPMLCMIDEIFKGTNSADRIVGAGEAIRRLATGHNMVMVSTHDFELCELESSSGEKASNYHFEEHYEDDRLCFDYRMKEGRCTTTNARAILRMAGFKV